MKTNRVMAGMAIVRHAKLLVVLATSVVMSIGCSGPDRTDLIPLQKHLTDYTTIEGLKNQHTSVPYIRGKLVTVNKVTLVADVVGKGASMRAVRKEEPTTRISTLMLRLPTRLRATRHEEVQSVVWLKYSQSLQGGFGDGSGAYREACDVTLVDLSIPAIIDKRSFRGSGPADFKSMDNNQDTRGGSPNGQILKYLVGLPHKQ